MEETKDKIITRLVLTFTFFVAIMGLLAYFLIPRPPENLLFELLLAMIPGIEIACFTTIILYFFFRRPFTEGLMTKKELAEFIRDFVKEDADNLLKKSFIKGNFICREYPLTALFMRNLRDSAKILKPVITRAQWLPDVIIGVNQGGTIMAATLSEGLQNNCVGVINTGKKGSAPEDREINYISIPDISLPPKRTLKILVLDSKLKSGLSALKTKEKIINHFEEEVDIAFGFALVYNDKGKRKKQLLNVSRWPIEMPVKVNLPKHKDDGPESSIKVFSAFYTNSSYASKDLIWEELRGWEEMG